MNRLRRGLFAAMAGGGAAPIPPFSPLSVPGLLGWYDFSDITTLFQDITGRTTPVTANNHYIGTVADKSGNNHDLHSDSISPNRRLQYKTNIQNSRSAALDSTGDALVVGDIVNTIGSGDFGYVGVVKTSSSSSIRRGLMSFDNTNPDFYIFGMDAKPTVPYPEMSYITFSNVFTNSKSYVIENYMSSGIISLALNAVVDPTTFDTFDTGTVDPRPVIQNPAPLMIMKNAGTKSWKGHIMEFCFYAGNISGYLTLLRNYFNTKWVVY